MINEFQNRQFPCSVFVPMGPSYENLTGTERVCSTVGATLGDDFVLGDNYLDKSFHYVDSHLWRQVTRRKGQLQYSNSYNQELWDSCRIFDILLMYLFDWCRIHYCSTSKGEVLIFQRSHRQKENYHEDEEARPVHQKDESQQKSTAADKEGQEISLLKQIAIFHWKDVCYDIKIKG